MIFFFSFLLLSTIIFRHFNFLLHNNFQISHSGSVHTTWEEFKIGGFALKTHQLFSVNTTPEKFKNPTITGHFEFVLEGNSGKKIACYGRTIVFEKLRFQNVSRSHENRKPVYSNSFFEKLRFQDALVWTVGLTVEIKLQFQISPAHGRPGLSISF